MIPAKTLGSRIHFASAFCTMYDGVMPLVLSIDIDFFVQNTVHRAGLGRGTKRPENVEHLLHNDVDQVLERCSLRDGEKIPGRQMEHHVDAFYDIRDIVELADGAKVELVNLDAHSDVGFGAEASEYLMTDLMQREIENRRAPTEGPKGLNLANWILFCVANEWLSLVTHVRRQEPKVDRPGYYFGQTERYNLRIPKLTSEEHEALGDGRLNVKEIRENDQIGAECPFVVEAALEFSLDRTPDYLLVCRSPQYSPESADAEFDKAVSFIDEVTLGPRKP